MGRGPILPIKNWCSCGIGVSDGLITSILIIERLSYVPFWCALCLNTWRCVDWVEL
jgi:hypothetical protein